MRNVKVLQDFFGFQMFVCNQAQSVISKLEELDILGNIDTLKEYQNGEKLTISKKLMKIKNSPVLEMNKEELINKIPWCLDIRISYILKMGRFAQIQKRCG